MSTPVWFIKLVKVLFPLRFPIARLTRLPVIGTLTEKLLFSGDRVIFAPQTQRISIHAEIAQESIVIPTDVVDFFIRHARHRFIMNTCVCRSANHCQTYPQDLGCLFLGEAVTRINPALGRWVGEEEALAHAAQARAVGLVHTIGRSRIDALLMGASPSHKLLTICHCCSCCCLWNTLTEFHPQIAQTVQRMPGVQVVVNDNCIGCGACTQDGCFVDAIRLEDGSAKIGDACRGCGRCVDFCPQGAIEIRIEDPRFIREAAQQIGALVDLS